MCNSTSEQWLEITQNCTVGLAHLGQELTISPQLDLQRSLKLTEESGEGRRKKKQKNPKNNVEQCHTDKVRLQFKKSENASYTFALRIQCLAGTKLAVIMSNKNNRKP